jgi:hypothetical protein
MSVIKELERPETGLAVQALRELRPRWTNASDLVKYVDEVLRPQGYRLAGAFEDNAESGRGRRISSEQRPECRQVSLRL